MKLTLPHLLPDRFTKRKIKHAKLVQRGMNSNSAGMVCADAPTGFIKPRRQTRGSAGIREKNSRFRVKFMNILQ